MSEYFICVLENNYKKTFMDLFWIFAIICAITIYGCGRWLYCYKQRYDSIKSKRLNDAKDCVIDTQRIVESHVEMNVEMNVELLISQF